MEPVVYLLFPPVSFLEALSIKRIFLAPLSDADIAAHKAAFPPPTTMTS